METEFLTRGVLLTTENYNVVYQMPATVSCGHLVKANISIEKLTTEDVSLSYEGVLQLPAFVTEDGINELNINLEDISLGEGESLSIDYWMQALKSSACESNIILKTGSAAGEENGKSVPVPANFTIKVILSESTPREIVNREIGKLNLEMLGMTKGQDYIRLADLKLVRTDSAYIIESVTETGIKNYVTTPAEEMKRGDYLEYFVREASLEQGSKSRALAYTEKEYTTNKDSSSLEIATGIVEIPLGENARKGDIFYSGEIVHGLGKANVYVDVGYEYLREDEALGVNAKSTIYGNPDIFAKDQRTVVDAETAVRVLNDKGSFIVGARLLKNIDYLVLTYRWVAIKFPSGNDLGLTADFEGKSIAPETPTVRMGTKESHYFGVRFNNMDKCSVTYEMTEAGTGDISSDGIYTAPSKPGVYEIRIYCTDMPVICTYAYAIVEKKGYEELELAEGEKPAANPLSRMIK